MVTKALIVEGLRALGLNESSSVLVHASLRSFGRVDGGAETVCQALVETCGTAMMVAGSWELTGLPAPPRLVRPQNACYQADRWEAFDEALSKAASFTPDLPVDKWLGTIAETMRTGFPHHRGGHPLLSFVAVGAHARRLIESLPADTGESG